MLQPGYVINERYRVEKLLGSGGMADVYLVTHMRMPRKFALKVMRLESNSRQAFLDRFNQEGEILATIRHPHIVDVIDRDQLSDGNPYLVMELLEGEDLATFLARTGALSVPVAIKICSQIGDALEAAHKVGVVHRDLKPSNVFLSKEGQVLNFVKVLDFGIAKMTAPDKTPMTAPAALMGTPAYMSPEQALGLTAKIDARTDQFALAAVLYEMLAGKSAFNEPGDVVYAILDRVVNRHPAPLKEVQINRVVMRALSKNPEDRFPTLRDFLSAVGATTNTIYGGPSLAQTNVGTISSQIGERTIPAQRRGRRRIMATAGFVLGLAAIALGAGSALKHYKPHPPVLPTPIRTASAPSPVAQPVTTGPALQAPPLEEAGAPPPPVSPTPAVSSSETRPAELPSKMVATTAVSNVPAAGGEVKKAGPKPSSAMRGVHLFSISNNGKAGFVDPVILACAREHLGHLGLREGTVIKLERSGTLVVVDAPPVVFESNFNACLRHGLSRVTHAMLPETVSLKVIR